MARIVVLGAGICGLTASLLLARDGHDVTVLERDAAPVPDGPGDAWAAWERAGVVQFRQPHFLQARGRRVLDDELPDVAAALAAAGAVTYDPTSAPPPSIADTRRRPGDEALATLTARRPTLEHVFACAAEEQPRLEVRRGVRACGLRARPVDGTPHVTGVRTDAGATVEADLVVDASGRRSPTGGWLREAGARALPEEAGDAGFVYLSRFFRSDDGSVPPLRSAPLTPLGSFSVLTLPGDDGTWSITLYVAGRDRPLKGLRHPERFTALVRACPRHAHLLDGEPVTGVLAMGATVDRLRRFVVDGEPVATGLAAVGDAWACTNPSLGRGMALGLVHAARLRDVARAQLDEPRAFALAWDEVTRRELEPWYRATVAVDRARSAEIEALRARRPVPAPADRAAAVRAALPKAMAHDPDVFRAGLEVMGCLTLPDEVLARPGLAERVLELARATPAPPGPTREQVLALAA
jgi:2-polyprenyl-6-methoxyphenol hydroxylase-like FAD-dependent oxidoreductase